MRQGCVQVGTDYHMEKCKEILPAGRGMIDVQLLVLNPPSASSSSFTAAGIGELGELYVRSPHIANG